jgi:predicted CopG family antitoxin
MGEYGESVSNISKELRATQDSFSKILNPLLDKKRGISQEMENEGQDSEESEKEINQQKPSPKKSRQEAKDSASFEDYLR